MNILVKNNLHDVDDIYEARKNLLMKSCAELDSNNVNIECPRIEINNLKLKFYNPNEDTFIQCDLEGNLILDPINNGFPLWLKNDINDIDVTIFNNDINVLTYDSLCNVVLTGGDYNDLIRKPYLWDNEDSNKYCVIESNLSDTYNIDTIYSKLNLNKYVRCNLEPKMIFDSINLDNLNLQFIQNKSGIVNILFNNFIKIEDISYTDTNTYGLGIVKNDPNTLTDLSTSYYLNTKYRLLYDQFSIKNENYQKNIELVIQYLLDNRDIFTDFNSNLSEIIDKDITKETLELNKILNTLNIYEDYIDFTDLILRIKYKSLNIGNGSFLDKANAKFIEIENPIDITNDSFFFIHINKNIDILIDPIVNLVDDIDIEYIQNDYSDFPYASLDTLGIVKIYNRTFTEANYSDTNSTFSTGVFSDITRDHIDILENIIDIIDFQSFLEELYATGIDDGSNLLRFSCNLEEIRNFDMSRRLLCYKNLQLEPIVYTNDYNTLFNKPNNISCFSNDIPFLSKYQNLYEFNNYEDKMLILSNLQIGTLGMQNIDNVNINGSNANMDFMSITSTLTFSPIDPNIYDMYLNASHDTGDIIWNKLPEYNDNYKEDKGIVKIYDDMIYDENNTFTSRLLYNTYIELKDKLIDIQNKINIIHSHM